ncbi:MAG: polysaccharide deacetylase family protein [Gaiellaceae bacterium]
MHRFCGRRNRALFVLGGALLFVITAQAGAQRPSASPDAAAVGSYLQLGKPIFCGGGNAPYVAFTFDDGPGLLTSQLVTLLRSTGVPGTFFLIGRKVIHMPGVVRQEMKLGVLGDHTWDHPQLLTLENDPRGVETELSSTKVAISKRTGLQVSLFRAPFGQQDATIDGIAQGLGLLDIEWSVAVDDIATEDVMYQALVDHVQAGSIVLMHENQPGEIEALARFLPVLHDRGLTAVTVPQLLALDPPDRSDLPNWAGQCEAHWHS